MSRPSARAAEQIGHDWLGYGFRNFETFTDLSDVFLEWDQVAATVT